jgi:hypothetical protein
MHLGNLDNEVIFKKVFTNVEVFTAFVKDVVGIDIDIDRVETERELNRKTAHIRFKMDLFAESKDHRVIVEIQKVDYDYNHDRFVHYFLANVLDQQREGEEYAFAREVYTIVVITAPYKINEKSGKPLRDDVLLTTLNPQTLNGQVRQLYGHKLMFLNPNYMGLDTPPQILDWMALIHESIHHPENPRINLSKPAIMKAALLAEIDEMDGRELYEAKNQQARKSAAAVMKAQTLEEATVLRIQNALRNGKFSKETIAELNEVTVEFVNQVESEIDQG